MKILLVDDDPLILELVPLMAAKLGYDNITAVSSAEQAWHLLNNGNVIYDCLLFDIVMPGMDGVELCGLTRTIASYRKTPIIMLTLMAGQDYIDRAFKAGATDYVTKPIGVVELGARLRMATEVVTARQNVSAENIAPSKPPLKATYAHPFNFTSEIEITGFKKLVSYEALGNYLAQLSRAGLRGSQVIAVTMDQGEGVYTRGSPDEFDYAVYETADAICEALETSDFLASYTGSGIFVVVVAQGSSPPLRDIEREIQYLLDEKDLEYDDGSPLDITVSVGSPVIPSLNNAQSAIRTCDRAIARAQHRRERKNEVSRPVNIRIVGR
ncbi:response regulator [Sulfitobacter delicatus]|uniref:Diguanylate cyclase, GGDEF domain n=1 Tax=Sulfitobacter delicatus TaxID=218672 RepID=A0A1G7Z7K2_9RHOB|nr:response regulator [Sulfitobacter delicatus]SDH04486.1 Diguanylate cyclase, GGDEF domain [Sulfitobacter delicatus]